MTQAQATRKLIITLARRRQRAGTGSAILLLRKQSIVMKWPNVGEILIDVPFAVVGAVATRLYMPERMTRDLDIAVAPKDFARALQVLAAARWEEVGELSIGGQTWRAPDGVLVDILEAHESWWNEALEEAQNNRDEQGLPILPLPYLVLMKFRASRTIDLGDLTRMLGLADETSLEKTRTLFRQYEADGLEDLESLIELGRLEMQ